MDLVNKALHRLSHPQKRIWYTECLHPRAAVHHIGGCVRIHGMLDFTLLETSIHSVIQSHEGLRLRLRAQEGEPQQYVANTPLPPLPRYDFSSSANPQAAYEEWVNMEAAKRFELFDSPLYHIAIFKVGEQDNGFLLKAHHIICDGWSMDLLTRQILGRYQSLARGDNSACAVPEPSYLTYLDLESQYLHSRRCQNNKQFWENKFDVLPEPLFDKTAAVPAGRRYTRLLDKQVSERISRILPELNVSLPLLLSAAFGWVLGRYYQREDLILSIPVSGRSADTKATVGMFTGNLPLSLHLKEGLSIRTFLQRVRREYSRNLANHKYPYDLLAQHLQLRKKGHDSLYQAAVNYYNTHLLTTVDGMKISNEEFYPGEQAYPLQLMVKDWSENGTLLFTLDYQTQIIGKEEAEMLVECLLHVLNQMLQTPDLPLKELTLCTEQQREQTLIQYNLCSVHNYPVEQTVMNLYAEQVRLQPDRIAVSCGEEKLTFGELAQRVNALAAALTAEFPQVSGVIGVRMLHSSELVIAILAVLQCGAAFLPLDPGIPAKRAEFMLQDSEAVCLLTDQQEEPGFSWPVPTHNTRDLLWRRPLSAEGQQKSRPEGLAYILYTSGSTGTPKGVKVLHSNLANYITWAAAAYLTTEQEVFAFYSSIAFDLTLTSLFVPLVSGTQLRIYPSSGEDYTLSRILNENRATVIKLTPSHLALMGEEHRPDAVLRTLIVGGENLRTGVAAAIQRTYGPKLAIYNEYGPTEATVGCMIHRYNPIADQEAAVPVGVPAANAKLYILDRHLRPLPPGARGELYISGPGVAAGYVRQPELTAERFLPDPVNEGNRMYRTGDLVRLDENGVMEYIGRCDTQVKVRGYRIETEEIEHYLLKMEGVRNAVVMTTGEGPGMELVACIVGDSLSAGEIRSHLTGILPAYMVPGRLIFRTEIPLTANGKINRRQLVQEINAALPQVREYEAVTHTERLLSALQTVLGRKEINLADRFFNLGGDSIKAIQISSLLKNQGLHLSAADILDHPLISEMRLHLTEDKEVQPQGPAEGLVPLTPILSWFLSQRLENQDYYLQSMLLELREDVAVPSLTDSLREVIRQHDSLRLHFDPVQQQLTYNNTLPVSEFQLNILDLSSVEAERREQEFQSYTVALKAGIRLTALDQFPFRACLIMEPGRAHRLLLAAHHVCIDGVSWRIVLEDLGRLLRGDSQLPPKTSSFQRWSLALGERAEPLIQPEREYWSGNYNLPEDHGFWLRQQGSRDSLTLRTLTLGLAESELLLEQCEQSKGLLPHELLQTALALTLHDTWGWQTLVIWLEGHGREPLFPEIDLSRTTGWFTSLYPVRISVDPGTGVNEKRDNILGQFRAVPRKGLGYGILAYGLGQITPAVPRIIFNYLGEFQEEYGNGLLRVLNEPTGPDIAGTNTTPFALEINAYILNRRLYLELRHPSSMPDESMEQWMRRYEALLVELLRQPLIQREPDWTPADFDAVDMTQEELDSLFK
ncbi:amino acid adenylation domain-containing protein [Paenibacillus albidus]|uniref:non-ribosomal peptide synthetase n=1 Tax=Paenibacillus albidus TaxID=2041023 RepID=UPI001BE88B27|nr:non-ribosomal peptide synthetase [Paenibacillus albidus]MBT2291743.1 amino acid adenylation domain-containing protein [Paenibacillus albidus]